jgi:LSD1 subclass zinc finger protein
VDRAEHLRSLDLAARRCSNAIVSALELLRCPECATPVALADAPAVRCPSCGADVPVPDAHRAAFAHERREAETRAEATRLYAQLGRPPLALRAIGVAFAPGKVIPHPKNPLLSLVAWYYRVALVVIAPMAMLLVAILIPHLTMLAIGRAQHANYMDTLSSSTRDWIDLPFAFAAFLVGTALGVYGRRRAIATHHLQACLAARPPSREGGPSECRSCGAPLSVPDGAYGVRCVYCGSDNLVALPPAWINAVKRDVAQVAGAIDEAAAALAAEGKRLRRAMRWQLAISAAALAAILAIAAATQRPHPPTLVPPTWSAFAGDPRPLVLRDRRGLDQLAGTVEPLAVDGGCTSLHEAKLDCVDGPCVARVYLALRRGDEVALRFPAAPATVRVARHTGWVWPDTVHGTFGPLVGTDARFTADWSAWYELALTYPPAFPNAVVCATVTPSR